MTARNEFDIINAIANSNGEATLMVKVGTNPVPTRIPVKMVNVNVETDEDGTRVSIPCEAILPTIDFKRNYLCVWGEDKSKVSTAIDWDKFTKQYMNQAFGRGAPITPNELREGFELLHKPKLPKIKNVIHSAPATIVFWMDGTKTVVKAVNRVSLWHS